MKPSDLLRRRPNFVAGVEGARILTRRFAFGKGLAKKFFRAMSDVL